MQWPALLRVASQALIYDVCNVRCTQVSQEPTATASALLRENLTPISAADDDMVGAVSSRRIDWTMHSVGAAVPDVDAATFVNAHIEFTAP